MKISDGEKLILLMLSELYDTVGVEGEIDPDFVRSAIFGEHLWGLRWKYSGIPFEQTETPEIVKEVADILEMWNFIEWGYNDLNEQEREKLKADAEPFGSNPKFPGFDGNNEAEYLSVAHFLINDLERFQDFKARGLNSHFPSLDMHHRMLEVFSPMRKTLMGGSLSLGQLTQILQTQSHPENRDSDGGV